MIYSLPMAIYVAMVRPLKQHLLWTITEARVSKDTDIGYCLGQKPTGAASVWQ